jgi:hypothetical protein
MIPILVLNYFLIYVYEETIVSYFAFDFSSQRSADKCFGINKENNVTTVEDFLILIFSLIIRTVRSINRPLVGG